MHLVGNLGPATVLLKAVLFKSSSLQSSQPHLPHKVSVVGSGGEGKEFVSRAETLCERWGINPNYHLLSLLLLLRESAMRYQLSSCGWGECTLSGWSEWYWWKLLSSHSHFMVTMLGFQGKIQPEVIFHCLPLCNNLGLC